MVLLYRITSALFYLGGNGKFCSTSDKVGSVFEEHQFEPRKEGQNIDDRNGSSEDYRTIDGLGCVDNKTLNFYSLDLDTQKTLGERIGLNLAENTSSLDKTIFVAIVSPDQEVVYEMKANLEHKQDQHLTLGESISTFVNKFHNNPSQLIPLRISKKLTVKSQKPYEQGDKNVDICDDYSSNSCIQEINGETFNHFVMEESRNKNIIILYKTSSCAFCTAASSAAHVFHTVSRLFRYAS